MSRQENYPLDEVTPTTSGSSYQPGTGYGTAGGYPRQSSETGESAHSMVERGKEKATAQLDSQRMRIAEGLDGLAQAIHSMSRELQGEQAMLASYANQGAEQVDHFARYLQEHDVNELVTDVERYARQRPALFIGGAFALGLVASRFLKSSSH